MSGPTDNDLFTLVRGVILAGLAARGQTVGGTNGWRVTRRYQPTQQGANIQPTVYLFKINSKRHGSPGRQYLSSDAPPPPVPASSVNMNATTTQQMEWTGQAAILLTETTDPAALTPGDALDLVADIMQSDDALATFAAAGVGILRIADERNPYVSNDKTQYQADPSFDFVLTFRRSYTAVTPAVATYNNGLKSV